MHHVPQLNTPYPCPEGTREPTRLQRGCPCLGCGGEGLGSSGGDLDLSDTEWMFLVAWKLMGSPVQPVSRRMSVSPGVRRWPRTLPSSSGCIQKHSAGTKISLELQVPCNACGSSLGRWACGVGRTTMDAPFSSSSIVSKGPGQLFLSTTSRLWKPVFKSLLLW